MPVSAPIAIGDKAPDFTLPAVATDQTEFEARLGEILELGPLMLVFYQDDGMPICTSELKAFAQEHELLAEAGVQVFGINTNGIPSHKKFQERDAFPFALISDFQGDTIKAYGLWDEDEKKARRAVVVVSQDGTVKHVVPHFNPGNVQVFAEIFESLGLI